MDLVQTAKKIIHDNLYFTLGTTDGLTSWVSPLFFAHGAGFAIYYVSPKDSRHQLNIQVQPKVSLVWFDSHAPKWTGIGLYAEGRVQELVLESDISLGLKLIWDRLQEPVPPPADFQNAGIYRVYRCQLSRTWITSDRTVAGKTIDARTEIELT